MIRATEAVETVTGTTAAVPPAPAAKAKAAAEPKAATKAAYKAPWPMPPWDQSDPFAAEKDAMQACVDGTRPTRPKGGFSLLRRLRACGTGAQCLEMFFDMLPKDRYGVRTGADLPVDEMLEAMLIVIEQDEANPDLAVPRLDRYTYEKAKQIAKTGYWTPPVLQQLKITNAFEDEAFDPTADEDAEAVVDKKPTKGKRTA